MKLFTGQYEFDENGNMTYWETSDNYWEKREFDENNNRTYFENSKGTIIDNRAKEMSAKEALNKIWRDTYPKSCETWSADRLCEHWRVVEKALTPPTVDEVCKALSEYYDKKVIFKENVFWYIVIIFGNEEWVRDVSLKDLSKDNRVDLIASIGRFYEELEK